MSAMVAAPPNPSLERTSPGLALGPRGGSGHHPPRGPSANPVSARSAQTLDGSHNYLWPHSVFHIDPWRLTSDKAGRSDIPKFRRPK